MATLYNYAFKNLQLSEERCESLCYPQRNDEWQK
jgi:hypothetical protein